MHEKQPAFGANGKTQTQEPGASQELKTFRDLIDYFENQPGVEGSCKTQAAEDEAALHEMKILRDQMDAIESRICNTAAEQESAMQEMERLRDRMEALESQPGVRAESCRIEEGVTLREAANNRDRDGDAVHHEFREVDQALPENSGEQFSLQADSPTERSVDDSLCFADFQPKKSRPRTLICIEGAEVIPGDDHEEDAEAKFESQDGDDDTGMQSNAVPVLTDVALQKLSLAPPESDPPEGHTFQLEHWTIPVRVYRLPPDTATDQLTVFTLRQWDHLCSASLHRQ
jgi:hypothetical protein